MLWKMLIHGVVAAALIGSAAAIYAQATDSGYLSSAFTQPSIAPDAAAKGGDGNIRPSTMDAGAGEDGKTLVDKTERSHEGRERHHDKDDD